MRLKRSVGVRVVRVRFRVGVMVRVVRDRFRVRVGVRVRVRIRVVRLTGFKRKRLQPLPGHIYTTFIVNSNVSQSRSCFPW